jgi:hypothetical protein
MNSAIVILVVLIACANAMHWDNWHNYCSKETYGHRTHSAKLWHIKGSWEDACGQTGADIKHHGEDKWTWFAKPTRCVKNNGMWGEFDVPDASCLPRYDGFDKNECSKERYGLRKRGGILRGIPSGYSWEDAVARTGATIDGIWYASADHWVKNRLHIWGVFYVPDEECKPRWIKWQDKGCMSGSNKGMRRSLLNFDNHFDNVKLTYRDASTRCASLGYSRRI